MKILIAEVITAAVLAVGAASPEHVDRVDRLFDARHQAAEQVFVVDKEGIAARPNPQLTPGELVTLTLEALQHNNTPYTNAGIATAFRFSSPDNRASSGPLGRFVQLVHGQAYSPLLNHQHARLGAVEAEGNEAWLPVVIVSERAERYGYTFRLTRQEEGDFAGCWMVEGVFPFEVPPADKALMLVSA